MVLFREHQQEMARAWEHSGNEVLNQARAQHVSPPPPLRVLSARVVSSFDRSSTTRPALVRLVEAINGFAGATTLCSALSCPCKLQVQRPITRNSFASENKYKKMHRERESGKWEMWRQVLHLSQMSGIVETSSKVRNDLGASNVFFSPSFQKLKSLLDVVSRCSGNAGEAGGTGEIVDSFRLFQLCPRIDDIVA